MKNKKIIRLEHVFITPSAYERWAKTSFVYAKKILKTAVEKRISFSLEDIPDEQFRADEDGNGEIFIEVPKLNIYFSVVVHPHEWMFIGAN